MQAGKTDWGALEELTEQLWALLPGLLVVVLGFQAGGYFPGTAGLTAAALAVLVAVRVCMVQRGGMLLTRLGATAVAGLALFTGWSYVSKSWSHAPARALLATNLDIIYLLVVALFATTPTRLRTMLRGLAAGAGIVCGAGLLSRVLPKLVPVATGFGNDRLSYPVTYWNALGLLAALGIMFCVGLASDPDEPPVARAVWAALVPALAVTLLLTFSRASIAAAVLMLVIYAVVRPRLALAILIALLAVPTGAAVLAGYDADQLATAHFASPAGVSQGGHVALVVAIAMLAAGALSLLTMRLARAVDRGHLSRKARIRARIAMAAIVLAVLIAFSGQLSHQYHRFLSSGVASAGGTRARLGSLSNNGRVELWRVAWQGFQSAPLKGHGAGTYALLWTQKRPSPLSVVNAHSLYLETLDELGLIGLVLLLGALLALLVGAARRVRTAERGAVAAIAVAVLVAWALRAGIDWDWQMPVITLPVLALAAAAGARTREEAAAAANQHGLLARLHERIAGPSSPVLGRLAPAAVCLCLGLAPTFVAVSQGYLASSVSAIEHGKCAQASSEAQSAISAIGSRPEAYAILGYCDARHHQWRPAANEMRLAIARDPNAWEYHYGLALALATGGVDPHPELQVALNLNPREQILHNARSAFRKGGRAAWRRAARATGLTPPP